VVRLQTTVSDVQEAMLHEFLATLRERPCSFLASHGAPCCDIARAWFETMARSMPPGDAIVAWIPKRWQWGPHTWPLNWCEAVARDTLDCGALAALAHAAATATGQQTWRVQLVEQFDVSATQNWRVAWNRAGANCDWLHGPYAYHEVIATEGDGEFSLWDPTDCRRIDSTPRRGYASIAALRVLEAPEPIRPIRWRSRRLEPGIWHCPDAH